MTALVVGGICLHKGGKALEGKNAKFGEKLRKGWEKLWHKGEKETKKIAEETAETTRNASNTTDSAINESEREISETTVHVNSELENNGKNTQKEQPKLVNKADEHRPTTDTMETRHSKINEIKTPEEVLAEFNRVRLSESQEIPQSKKVLDEAVSEIMEYTNKDPREILKSKNLLYEFNNCNINILNEEGEVIKRMYFIQPIDINYTIHTYQLPYKIININPKNKKITKIIEAENDNQYVIRLFNENGRKQKEYFMKNINQGDFIVKDYSSEKIVPDKLSVYNLKSNEVKTIIEYNTETGYPNIAYADNTIYKPREGEPFYFNSIISDNIDINAKTQTLNNLVGTGNSPIDQYILPRLTKDGYIVEKGPSMVSSDEKVLLDDVTHRPVFSFTTKGNDLMIKMNPETTNIKTLWIENNEIICNKFDESPKEVLKKMKEIFADLTPDLYDSSSTTTNEIIDRFISALKS